ncbi:TetR/AcrR family transcriptional regulator [Taklimakanibacter deserti]|uniref:TetR/AcrR family transcriptional regulator n=1 Tax=Taklimakanibacter deserti TaxID=2267839 RepID=UPI000E655A38
MRPSRTSDRAAQRLDHTDEWQAMGLRERQKIQRGERIISAAAGLFNEFGYQEVTIEDIANRAEVSAATVRNYYVSKGQLLLAIVERGDEEIHRFALKIAAGPLQDAIETLNEVVAKTTNHSLEYLNHKVWRHAIATSITRDEPDYGTGFSAIHGKFIESYEAVVRALQKAGKLSMAANATMMASVLYKIQHSLFVELIGETELDFKRYLARQRAHVEFIVSPHVPD